MRKSVRADWLAFHEAVPDGLGGVYWRQGRTRALTLAAARKKPPTPRYLVQDLERKFEVAILISPVMEGHARRRCMPLLLRKENQETKGLQGFEQTTPRRDPQVEPDHRNGHTSLLATSATSSQSGMRWSV